MSTPSKQPISVLVVIHSPEWDVLLIERKDKPGFWQSVTGSKEGLEPLADTARREVLEETGIDTSRHLPHDWQQQNVYEIYEHWRHRYPAGVTENTEHVFSLCIPKDTPITLAPQEHLRHQWLDIDTAAELVFSPSNRDAILMLRHKGHS
ncbi:MAG: dihydroneopterin triphosphate diphosphatase [Neisseriaceae bacterium]|nr:dihydroneopterin triphosphate diphosphatase [Neisseriaceae bacterium]